MAVKKRAKRLIPAGTVSAAELAALLKLESTRRIHQLAKDEGMPKAGRGQFHAEECVLWYVGYLQGCVARRQIEFPKEQSADRARGDRITADLKEIELAERRGDSLPKVVVRSEIASLAYGVRGVIDAMPGQHAHRVLNLPDLPAANLALQDVRAELVAQLRHLLPGPAPTPTQPAAA